MNFQDENIVEVKVERHGISSTLIRGTASANDESPDVQRRCGGCQLCCIVYTVPEMDKAAQERCRHLCAAGCAIHDSPRPEICTAFECEWLRNKKWPDNVRPDKSGLVFSDLGLVATGRRQRVYMAAQATPYAYLKRTTSDFISRLTRGGHVVGILYSDEEGEEVRLECNSTMYPNLSIQHLRTFMMHNYKQHMRVNGAFYRSRRHE